MVLGPLVKLSHLRSNIFAEIVEKIGSGWDEMFGRLLQFRTKHKHCRVPISYEDRRLAFWVRTQRYSAITEALSTDRTRRLNDIGFEWDPRAADWEQGFAYLKDYRQREGHCRVSANYEENGFRLGQWVRTQRSNRDTLSAERRQLLNNIG